MGSNVDFFQLFEELNDLDPRPLSMTMFWIPGDVLFDMGDQFQPQPQQVSSLLQTVPAMDRYHEDPVAPQGQLAETRSEWEGPNPDPFLEIEEVLQQTDDGPTADTEEDDPHKAASIQKILEHLLAGTDHLLPPPPQSLWSPPFHLTPPPVLEETRDLQVFPIPLFSHQHQNMLEHRGHMAETMLEKWVPREEIKDRAQRVGPSEVFTPAFNAFVLSPKDQDQNQNQTTMTRKRPRSNEEEEEERPYIKKPLNAFMVYRQEQRAKVAAELNVRDSALLNTELGLRWRSMTNQDKLKYFQEADRLKSLHQQQNPNWSSSNNYGKKRKRIRRKYSPTTSD